VHPFGDAQDGVCGKFVKRGAYLVKKSVFSVDPFGCAQGGEKISYFLAVFLLICVCKYVKMLTCLSEDKRSRPAAKKLTSQFAYL
jgi:hypothetical protein